MSHDPPKPAIRPVTTQEAGRNCPYCRFALKTGSEGAVCPACGALHHHDCWEDNGGCAIMGCTATPTGPPAGTAGVSGSRPEAAPAGRSGGHWSPIGLGSPAPVPIPSAPPPRRGQSRWLVGAISLLAFALAGVAVALAVSAGGSRPTVRDVARVARTARSSQRASTSRSNPSTSSASSQKSGANHGNSGQTGTAAGGNSPTGTGTGSTTGTMAPPSSALTEYSTPDFTLGYPAGWTIVNEGEQMSGYIDSRWQLPANPAVEVIADETPDVRGTLSQQANQLRQLYMRNPTYRQVVFQREVLSSGATTYTLKFIADGRETTDDVFMSCGNGFAVAVEAPANVYDSYMPLFTEVLESFRPTTC
jgi:hypothetical protein